MASRIEYLQHAGTTTILIEYDSQKHKTGKPEKQLLEIGLSGNLAGDTAVLTSFFWLKVARNCARKVANHDSFDFLGLILLHKM